MKITKELILRYHEGTCTEAERKAVEEWLQQTTADLSFPEELDMDLLQEEAWQTLQKKYDIPLITAKKKVSSLWIYSGVAASICLLLGITYFLRPSPSSQMVYKTIVVPNGKRVSVTLADGSIIYVNAGSTLQYPERFENDRRLVRLVGEAFFAIAKDPVKPFLVETPRSFTKVLGTHFNLRDFPNEHSSSIVVEEGKVRYNGKDGADTLILLAGNRGIWSQQSLQKERVDVPSYIDWKDHVLRFNDIPLAEAVPMIERWYGVQVELHDPRLAALHIKVSFRNAPLKAVLDDLAYLMNLKYKIHKNQVTLYR